MSSWPELNPQSARALVWAALFPLVVGPIATSYAAMFLGPVLAGVIALVPAAFGRRRTRLAASVLLALSLVVAFSKYPGYSRHMERWTTRARESAAEVVDTPLAAEPAPTLRQRGTLRMLWGAPPEETPAG